MSIMASEITGNSIFVQPYAKAHIEENIKARVTDPLTGVATGHWWISLRKGQ